MSRDFLFLAIKLNCSDRFSSKKDISKIAYVSQNVQSFKKIHPKETRENPLLTLLLLAMLFMCERAQITEARIISARGYKTIESHLN